MLAYTDKFTINVCNQPHIMPTKDQPFQTKRKMEHIQKRQVTMKLTTQMRPCKVLDVQSKAIH